MATPTYADIWKKLSVIDVSEFIKSRGIGSRTLSWIPWSDCLAILQSHYPDFRYEFFPVVFYPDGSAEVECKVTIGDVSRRILLPVMDHKFDAISNPSSRDINDARFRAFTKAVAIFGLGFQLYRDGSGVPVPVKTTAVKKVTKKKKTVADKKKEAKKDWDKAEHLMERIDELSGLIDACETHGNIDAKLLSAAAAIVADNGPLDRVEKAIKHLTGEVARV